MAWLADLAGKAESLLNNLDEHAGVALKGKQLKLVNAEHSTEIKQENGADKRNHFKKDLSLSHKKLQGKLLVKQPSEIMRVKPKIIEMKSHSMPYTDLGRVKASVKKQSFSLNNCPKTMVGDSKPIEKSSEKGFMVSKSRKSRANSLPSELDMIEQNNKLQNLVIENSMLKKELSKMNGEVSELMSRLRRTEDELSKQYIKNINMSDKKLKKGNKSTLASDIVLEQLQEKNKSELIKYKKLVEDKQKEITLLRAANKEYEVKLADQSRKWQQLEQASSKMETDWRHAQTVIKDQKANLERSRAECQRLEKDWDSYKIRVKGMLANKDIEIKRMQEGVNLTEDSKLLMEHIDKLKQENENLNETIANLRSENDQLKMYIDKVEERCLESERSVLALRETFKNEREAKIVLHEEILELNKNLSTLTQESARKLSELKEEIKHKESEINKLTANLSTSALNVADYDEMKKCRAQIEHMTAMLCQRQARIDHLLASNNMFRIQLDKLEAKSNNEKSHKTAPAKHDSIVNFHDGEGKHSRFGMISPRSCLNRLSVKIGVAVRRYPIFRTLILFYMLILHLWVFTVLLSSTPNLSYDFYGQGQLTKNAIKHVREKR